MSSSTSPYRPTRSSTWSADSPANKPTWQFTLASLMKTVTLSAVVSALMTAIGVEGFQRALKMGRQLSVAMLAVLLAIMPIAFAWLVYEAAARRCACGNRLGRREERCAKCAVAADE